MLGERRPNERRAGAATKQVSAARVRASRPPRGRLPASRAPARSEDRWGARWRRVSAVAGAQARCRTSQRSLRVMSLPPRKKRSSRFAPRPGCTTAERRRGERSPLRLKWLRRLHRGAAHPVDPSRVARTLTRRWPRSGSVNQSPDRARRSRRSGARRERREARRPRIPRWYLREEQRCAATRIGRRGKGGDCFTFPQGAFGATCSVYAGFR